MNLPFHITWQGLVAGVIVGIVLAPQIKSLPLVRRIPTA
jgi:hypothetical protein